MKRVVPKEGRAWSRKRAKELTKGDAIAAAVGSTVSDVQAATLTAATAATSASADGGGGNGGGS